MKTYKYKIVERATYLQDGTVTVVAVNESIARKKVMRGEYDHTGDNTIDLDTESKTKVIEATLVEDDDDD
jgi:hypothetical protein